MLLYGDIVSLGRLDQVLVAERAIGVADLRGEDEGYSFEEGLEDEVSKAVDQLGLHLLYPKDLHLVAFHVADADTAISGHRGHLLDALFALEEVDLS